MKSKNLDKHSKQSGFTLLEMIITLGILVTLSLALSAMLRSNLDIRDGLAENAKIAHRMASTMELIAKDVQHAFLVSEKDLPRFGTRKKGTRFIIIKGSEGDELQFTATSHRPKVKNANESDMTFLIYKLEENRDNGRTNLMRGETRRLPDSFRDEVKMRLIAKDIKTFKVTAWRGDEWLKDRWDSTRREWKNKLPHMVKIELVGWEEEKEGAGSSSVLGQSGEVLSKYQTIVLLPNSIGMPQLRKSKSAIRWDKL